MSINFFKTLINIITDSPSSIVFIIFGFVFLIAMIINIKRHKNMGSTLFIIGWIFVTLFAVIKYNSYLMKMFDNFINAVFMQLLFPNLASYLIIIVLMNIIFIYNIFNKKKLWIQVINVVLWIIVTFIMFLTLDQIVINKINIYDYEQVYENNNLVVLIESTTLIFVLYLIAMMCHIMINKLINKSDNKVKQKYSDKVKNDEVEVLEL